MSPVSLPSQADEHASTSSPAIAAGPLLSVTSSKTAQLETPKTQGDVPAQTPGLVLREHGFFGETYGLGHSTAHKFRLFGQSHCLTTAMQFRDLIEMTGPYLQDDNCKAVSVLQKCKTLARGIKSQRTPAWPTLPTFVLPSRKLADELVEAYLRTTETVYRVVHIPSFRRDYERLWLRELDALHNKTFLVQLNLVMAIGAATYDEKFSLRAMAIRWVYEAQTYLSEPNSKSRLGLQSVQTNILLLIARGATGVDVDSLWVSAGALLRSAMHIGLHRDPMGLPADPRPRFVGEMRRRLWNTTLELVLQSSLLSGKPPLLSPSDFDTKPPSNLDDDQLTDEQKDRRTESGLSQMSIPIALRKTFSLRLAAAKMLNDSVLEYTYEEMLKLDAQLRASYKEILPTVQPDTDPSAPRFDTCAMAVIMHHCLALLHVPFLGTTLHETAYAYSRKIVLDSALRIWHAANSYRPSASDMATRSQNLGVPSTPDYFSRFVVCGSGYFRIAAFQATLFAALELRRQLQEEVNLGPIMIRPDLLALVEDAKHFCLRCIEAGETNVKGYLFNCLAAAQIDGQKRGLGQDQLREFVLAAAKDAADTCLPLLEQMHSGGREDPAASRGDYGAFLGTPSETLEDWDLMMSDALLNFGTGTLDPMNWMVTDDLA